MKTSNIIKLSAFSAGAFLLAACSLTDNPVGVKTEAPAASETMDVSTLHPLGGKLIRVVGVTPTLGKIAAIPSAYDITSTGVVPIPGDQGINAQSCVAWAVGYSLKTIQEKQEIGWPISTSATGTAWPYWHHHFSPAFIYNQCNGGVNDGMSVEAAAEFLRTNGCARLGDASQQYYGDMMPYNPSDFTTQPTPEAISEGARYKADSWFYVYTLGEMKALLAAGKPLAMLIKVYPDWDTLKTTNPIYDNISGDFRGYHGVCAIGYDDAKGAIKVINSWGTGWGLNGYAWISYSLITNPNVVPVVVQVVDKVNDLKKAAGPFPLRDGDVGFLNQKGTTSWTTYAGSVPSLVFVTQTVPNRAYWANQRLLFGRKTNGLMAIEKMTAPTTYMGLEPALNNGPTPPYIGWASYNSSLNWSFNMTNTGINRVIHTIALKFLGTKNGTITLCAPTETANCDWDVYKY